MEKFTASNGVEVTRERGEVQMSAAKNSSSDYLYPDHEDALREFFLHERDQELGRWRWPENPDYVVYPIRQLGAPGKPAAGLLRESTCDTSTHGRNDSNMPEPVRAYFAAHPERKPWHAAKHLEIWALTIRGCGGPEAYIYREEHNRAFAFRPVNNEERVSFDREDPRIIAARRIWPKSADG